MQKGTGEFRKVEIQKTFCDECGQDVKIEDQIRWDAHWSDGYDSYGEDYDFCSIYCMLKHSERTESMFPVGDEDVTLEIPSKYIREIISKLS